MRPAQDVARGMKAVAWRKVLPATVEAEILSLPVGDGVGKLADKIHAVIRSLELISWEWDNERLQGIGRAAENVWGRAWRRKKLREKDEGTKERDVGESEASVFGFAVTICAGQAEVLIKCRWCEGHDASLFESFCGYLRGQLKA